MKIHPYSIAVVNVILCAFLFWLSWRDTHLAGQLDPQMQSDVMIQKYQNVCAELTASMTMVCLIVIVLINAVLIGPLFNMTTKSAVQRFTKRSEHTG